MLEELFPKSHGKYRSLALLGPILDDFGVDLVLARLERPGIGQPGSGVALVAGAVGPAGVRGSLPEEQAQGEGQGEEPEAGSDDGWPLLPGFLLRHGGRHHTPGAGFDTARAQG